MRFENAATVTIGRPRLGEVDAMLKVQQDAAVQSFVEELDLPREHVEAYVNSPGYVHEKSAHFTDVINASFRASLKVARTREGVVIGLGEISSSYACAPYAVLGSMYVSPTWRGHGIGSLILESLLLPYNEEPVRLETPLGSRAVNFYAKHKFKLTGEGYNMTRFPQYIDLPKHEQLKGNFFSFKGLGLRLPLVSMRRPPRNCRMEQAGLCEYKAFLEKRRLAALKNYPTTR